MIKKIFFYILIFIFTWGMTALVLELTIRLISHGTESRNKAINEKMFKVSDIEGVCYEVRPGVYSSSANMKVPLRINSLGLRGEEVDKNAKDRILVLGDSIIYARYLAEKDTGVYLLQQDLRRRLKRDDIQVINGALSSRGTSEEYKILEHLGDEIGPSVVVVGICLNDFYKLNKGAKDTGGHFKIYLVELLKERIGRIEGLRTFRRWLVKKIGGPNADLTYVKDLKDLLDKSEKEWPEWSREFDKIKEFCDRKGYKLVLTVFPVEPQIYPVPGIDEIYKEYSSSHRFLPKYCVDRNILFADMLMPYREYYEKTGKRLYRANDFLHPEREGQLIWARTVSDILKDKLR